jgi:hypothetical protein
VAVVSAMVRGALSRIRRRGRSAAETVVFDASRSARTGGLRAKSRVADNARRISILRNEALGDEKPKALLEIAAGLPMQRQFSPT